MFGLVLAGAIEVALIRLGRGYGSTPAERHRILPGDDLISRPDTCTDHAITIDAAPEQVWPWLVQMGWGRGGWYTARWVDRLLFPANGPSTDHVVPELQHVAVGDFIPDGPPDTECGFIVEIVDPGHALVLRSISHLPRSWRTFASVDWSWAFIISPAEDDTGRSRFQFRSRWTTSPWWFTAATYLTVVPADFVMSRSMLTGLRSRVEGTRVRASRCGSPSGDG